MAPIWYVGVRLRISRCTEFYITYVTFAPHLFGTIVESVTWNFLTSRLGHQDFDIKNWNFLTSSHRPNKIFVTFFVLAEVATISCPRRPIRQLCRLYLLARMMLHNLRVCLLVYLRRTISTSGKRKKDRISNKINRVHAKLGAFAPRRRICHSALL